MGYIKGKAHEVCGRKGLPPAAIAQMYADYLRLGSLSQAGRLHGRTRQAMFSLFHGRGLKLQPRKFKTKIKYNGRFYTPGKNGRLRDTIFRRGNAPIETQLHRKIWADLHGPIPPGHQIGFRDGNYLNFHPDNLFCLPIAEMTRRKATGANGATKAAPQRLLALIRGNNLITRLAQKS